MMEESAVLRMKVFKSGPGPIRLAAYLSTLTLILTGCGGILNSAGNPSTTTYAHHPSPPTAQVRAIEAARNTPAPVSPVSFYLDGPTWSEATQPKLVIFHDVPQILTINGNQALIWRRGHGQWYRRILLSIPAGKTVDSTALACDSRHCYAAIAYTQSNSSDHVAILRLTNAAWKSVGKMAIPNAAAIGEIALAPDGSGVWLLATGQPALGLMAKQLWVSQDTGQQWTLLATSDISRVSARLSFPPGYPTGLVALTPQRVIVSNSSRGNRDSTAIEYQANPPQATNLGFPIPARFSFVDEAFPALKGHALTIPVVAIRAQSAQLLWETRRSGTHWQTRLGPSLSPNPSITGHDTLVVVNLKTLQILSPHQPAIRAPLSSKFVNPVVATVIGRSRVVVLATHGDLWENTGTGNWRLYHGE